MKISQIAALTNAIVGEMTGDATIVQEDLKNIVDVGTIVMTQANWYDAYTKSLMDHVGKCVVTNKEFFPNKVFERLWKESYEFGAILERLTVTLPDAEDNPSWDLQDQQSYNSEIFYKPTVAMNCYNVKDTFQIPISIVEDQVKSAFSSREQYIAFVSGIYTAVNNSVKIRLEQMAKRAVNNMIFSTFSNAVTNSEYDTQGTDDGNARCINVLHKYNTLFNQTLTAAEAIHDKEFLRYFSFLLYLTSDRMREISTIFNVIGEVRFTEREDQNIFVLSEIAKALDVYLYGDTYHDEYVKLPGYETVTAWQGINDGNAQVFEFPSTSLINIKNAEVPDHVNNTPIEGVAAVIFDREAVAVTNERAKVTSAYSARGDFTTYYYKNELGLLNDLSMNCVVFTILDDTSGS